jgi:hypothetical protein
LDRFLLNVILWDRFVVNVVFSDRFEVNVVHQEEVANPLLTKGVEIGKSSVSDFS